MARKARKSKPKFAETDTPLRLVIEGVGDVIENYYKPALEEVKKKFQGRRDLQVTFVDKSEYWRDDARLAAKMQRIIKSIKDLGAGYLDKSDPADFAKYQTLEADVVIIATSDASHVEVAEAWLTRQPRPEQIFIEKPLADSIRAARRLLGLVEPYDDGILAFDHYRARLLPTREQMNVLLGFLGKGVRSFTFYFLEDHSGSDEEYVKGHPEATRNGPIENEQRVKALEQGIILDVMPHVIAILAHFGRVETLRVTRVRAGQYVGVDDDLDKRTEIDHETFAEVGFVCASHAEKGQKPPLIEGTVFVGKGVRGVRELGPEYDRNVKVLDIGGLNGNWARFDLRSSGQGAGKAYLKDELGNTQFELPLYRQPYFTFLEKVVDGTYLNDRLALHVEIGKRILEVLEDMRYPIIEKGVLREYPSGMRGIRPSLYLEEIVARLPVLFGQDRPRAAAAVVSGPLSD
jgi:predicted dehydrogenase